MPQNVTSRPLLRPPAVWALLPLRVTLGLGFFLHGLAKLERGPEKFAAIVEAIGMPAPLVTAWATSLLELVGGACLVVGLGVVPVSVPLGLVMLTALFKVHVRYGFSSVRLESLTTDGARFGPVGYELNLLYLAGLAALWMAGAGPASLDRQRDRTAREFTPRTARGRAG